MENKLFVNHASAGEIGTSVASMYRTGKKNAVKNVHNNYNEYSEFHAREVEAHICAAFMQKMSMLKMDGKSLCEYREYCTATYLIFHFHDNRRPKDRECVSHCTYSLGGELQVLVVKYIFNFNYIIDKPSVILPDDSVSKSIKGKWLLDMCSDFVREYVFQSEKVLDIVNKTAELDEKMKSPFACRADGCNKSYLSHSARVR
jgi:hypothetical protein